jgi:uncharacterized protein YdhG (YjbR/CyaY superfamily)
MKREPAELTNAKIKPIAVPSIFCECSLSKPKKEYQTIDEYIATFPEKTQRILQELRRTIREAAPQAEETISYRMPAFRLNGILVWLAAFRDHIGFFPKASAIEVFREELGDYETSKGTVRFPLDKPIPAELVRKIVEYRVKENLGEKK